MQNLDKRVHQCLKCWHKWDFGIYLRSNGEERTRCPECNSNQTMFTELNPTTIMLREDLLMFTNSEYPDKYCPQTTAEELVGNQGTIINQEGIKIFISRGFSNKEYGHYVYLHVDKKGWMTTNHQELESMQYAVANCPENARIFIGGLGLGLILLVLAHSKKAKEVLVVEKEARIIKYVEPIIRQWFDVHYQEFNWSVLHGDAVIEIEKHGLFDWIFFDIWSDKYGNCIDESNPDEVHAKAEQFLTPRGHLSIWTKIVEEIRTAKIDLRLDEVIKRFFEIK